VVLVVLNECRLRYDNFKNEENILEDITWQDVHVQELQLCGHNFQWDTIIHEMYADRFEDNTDDVGDLVICNGI